MRVIATEGQVADLPDTTKMFVKAGWGEPDENGVRQALPRFDNPGRFDMTGPVVADCLEAAYRDPDVVERVVTYIPTTTGGRFTTEFIWRDPLAAVLATLVGAWNERDALGTCQQCGSMFIPGKGRTAKFCSQKCRTAAHRMASAAIVSASTVTAAATVSKKGGK